MFTVLTAAAVVAVQVPEDMQDKEFAAILQEEPMQPLALVPLTEEEQVRLAPPPHAGARGYTPRHARAHTHTHTHTHTRAHAHSHRGAHAYST